MNTLEIEPISNSVLRSTLAPAPVPPATNRRPSGTSTPITMPCPGRDALRSAISLAISASEGSCQSAEGGRGGTWNDSERCIPAWLHPPFHDLASASHCP